MIKPPAHTDRSASALAEMPLERLEGELESMAAHMASAMARWLELVAEFDRREGWTQWGSLSCADWLAWRCALAPRTAREQLRVARRLRELPAVRSAFASGELSYSKARVLSRVAEEATEPELLELARLATAAQLETLVRSVERVSTEDADERHARRFLTWAWEEDGCLRLGGVLAPEEGAAVLRALELTREDLLSELVTDSDAPGDGGSGRTGSAEPPRDRAHDGSAEPLGDRARHGSAEPSSEFARPSVTNADAFVALAESSLERRIRSTSGPPTEIVVHVDLPSGHAHLEDGPALSAETARRLGCDASLVSLIERDGEPLSVGRRTRSVPPSMRRALAGRDRHCRFPGCARARRLEAHHIRHWAQGGPTSTDNLVLLCRGHHRLLHEGGLSIAREASGELSFKDARNRPIVPALEHPAPLHRGSAPIAVRPLAQGDGEPMNLGLAVDAVLQIRRRAQLPYDEPMRSSAASGQDS